MRRRLLASLLLLPLCGLSVVLLSRCFSPDLPDCSYICGTDDPSCPPEYECRNDGYCHLKGSTAACPYTMDLAPPADLLTLDASPPADGGVADMPSGG